VLLATNERLQRHIRSILDLKQKGSGVVDNSLGTAQARYTSLQQRLLEHHAMLTATEQHYERSVDSLRETLQTRLANTTSIQNVRTCRFKHSTYMHLSLQARVLGFLQELLHAAFYAHVLVAIMAKQLRTRLQERAGNEAKGRKAAHTSKQRALTHHKSTYKATMHASWLTRHESTYKATMHAS
jgi:hypothetical protein